MKQKVVIRVHTVHNPQAVERGLRLWTEAYISAVVKQNPQG